MMKDKKENIESLFREGFSDYHPQPTAETWQKLHGKLQFRNFLRFNPSSFNIFYTGILVALIITGITFLTPSPSHPVTQSPNHPFTQSPIHPFTHSPNHPFTHSPNHPVTQSPIPPVTQKPEPRIHELKTNKETPNAEPQNPKPIPTITQSPNHPVTHSPIHPITQSPIHPVTQSPIALFTTEYAHTCAPCQIQFKNNSINAISWEWSFGDGGSSEADNPVYIYDEPGTYYVTLTAVGEDHNICTHTEEIIIHPAPEVNFSMDINGQPGEGQAVYFYNYSKGAETYSWDFGDGGTSDLRDPSWLYNKAGDYNIKLKGVSEYGCADSMMIENAFAEKSPEIIFPNVFSPNLNGPSGGYYSRGENNNDVFHPYTAEEPVEYQLRIFNRHGNLIFESNDLRKGWDGYYKEELQPQGVYVWKIRGKYGNGESFVRMGDVTLLWRNP